MDGQLTELPILTKKCTFELDRGFVWQLAPDKHAKFQSSVGGVHSEALDATSCVIEIMLLTYTDERVLPDQVSLQPSIPRLITIYLKPFTSYMFLVVVVLVVVVVVVAVVVVVVHFRLFSTSVLLVVAVLGTNLRLPSYFAHTYSRPLGVTRSQCSRWSCPLHGTLH